MKTKNYESKIIASLLVISTIIVTTCTSITASALEIGGFTGAASVSVNDGVPEFTADEITDVSFEEYGPLDSLGRCTVALACVGTDIMPTEERGAIGSIKPSGWNQNKYPGIVDSEPPYLYNRCHLIGYQLTGENANERNLITGTRYLNVDGMLPYENRVANYVKTSGNHVMYRVTPIFSGNNLLSDGVQIEAYSVEDAGAGICFNVFCYNVQPGVKINYADGSNAIDDGFEILQTTESNDSIDRYVAASGTESIGNEGAVTTTQTGSYIANTNTKKFHYPSCSSVSDMAEKNKLYYEGSRDDLISQGYDPCKRCNP